MTDYPFVTIIIPVRNASAFLEKLLKALEHQTWPADRREIIMVDNGSSDDTAEKIRAHRCQASVTLLKENSCPSPYVARNRGMEAAKGEIIAMLDANKIPEPDWLEEGVGALTAGNSEKRPADLAGGEILFELPSEPGIGELTDAILFNNNRNLVMKEGASAAGNLFFRRKVWDQTKPFPAGFRSGMDVWWTRQAVKSGFNLIFAEKAVVWCQPRSLRDVLQKAFRVGKVHPYTMRSSGMSSSRVISHSLRTFAWPKAVQVRESLERLDRSQRRVHPERQDESQHQDELQRRVQPEAALKHAGSPASSGNRSRALKAWAGMWLARIFMASGRLKGIAGMSRPEPGGLEPSADRESSQRGPTIAYIYYTYFPVTGGASVHGYNLAKELNRLGYRLLKLNGDPDPYSEKRSKSPSGLIGVLRESDLVYIRMDYFLNFRNLIGLIALFSKKKVVVELNSPSDELHLFGRGKGYIGVVDRIFRWVLSRADAVIVVSEAVKAYAENALGLKTVHLVENGGEVFSCHENSGRGGRKTTRSSEGVPPGGETSGSQTPGGETLGGETPEGETLGGETLGGETSAAKKAGGRAEIAKRVAEFREKFGKIVVWAGSVNDMQFLEWNHRIAEEIGEDAVILMVMNDIGSTDHKPARQKNIKELENLIILNNLSREDVGYLISQADVGLAFYQHYPWSRWGFYNSSLKIFEYLNNGLLTITNVEGTGVQRSGKEFLKVDNPNQAVEAIRKSQGKPYGNHHDGRLQAKAAPVRTWSDVAGETAAIIESILRH